MSMLPVHVHSACPCPFCLSMSLLMLHVNVHAAYQCPCCMSMFMLHVHVHVACPCPCCRSMYMLHVHFHASCLCPCSCRMWHAHDHSACPCCLFTNYTPLDFCSVCEGDVNKHCHLTDGQDHGGDGQPPEGHRSEGLQLSGHIWRPWWRLAAIFSSKVIPHKPINNLWKFDVNIGRTNCFRAFLLKKSKKGQNTTATLWFICDCLIIEVFICNFYWQIHV